MRKWIPLLIVAAAFIASAIVYQRLPANIPTHWNVTGQPDKWSSRAWGAWMMPVFILGAWVLFRVIPAIDPRGANYAKFGGAFEGIVISVMLFMLALHIVVLRASLGHPADMRRVVPIGMGLLFLAIGNLLPRARPNWFVGIRTPWTLSSDRVWEKTHRLGGRVFVGAGIFITLAGIFAVQWAHTVAFTLVFLSVAAVVAYSYFEWRSEQPSPRQTS